VQSVFITVWSIVILDFNRSNLNTTGKS